MAIEIKTYLVSSGVEGATLDFGTVPALARKFEAFDIIVSDNSATTPPEPGVYSVKVTVARPSTSYDFRLEALDGWTLTTSSGSYVLDATTSLTISAGGSATIRCGVSFRCDETVLSVPSETVTIEIQESASTTPKTGTLTLSATPGAAQSASLVMVLDRSGSMSAQVAGVSRANRLRAAAARCLTLMDDGDFLGVVAFNHTTVDALTIGASPLGDGSSGTPREAAEALFSLASPNPSLNPSGSTSIGAGVVAAQTMLGAATQKSILVLTDGHENAAPLLSTVSFDSPTTCYAIGLGNASDVATAALETLTQSTSADPKYVLITGDLTGSQAFTLDKYFAQIVLDVNNSQIIVDPQATLGIGDTHQWPFTITEADEGFDAFVLTDQPGLIDFDLITPSGRLIDSSQVNSIPDGSFVRGQGILLIRFRRTPRTLCSDPVGTWQARVRMDPAVLKRDRKPKPVTYAFMAAARSDLKIKVSAQAAGVNVGAPILLALNTLEYGWPLLGEAKVSALVTYPDGTVATVEVRQAQRGRYALALDTFQAGTYTIRFIVDGKTLRGTRFTREAVRSVRILPAGQEPVVGLVPVPASEGGSTGPGQPLPGGGGSTPTPGSLDELFDRYPDLERLLRRCCHHAHDQCCCAPDHGRPKRQ